MPPLRRRRVSLPALLAALVGLGLAAAAIGHLGPHNVLHALVGVHLGWLALAGVLMVLSMLMRALSWLVVLRAALPGAAVPAAVVVRATMIGVMVSAVFPGRLGEAARAIVVARRVGTVSVVAGTILSQTMLNLVALVALGAAVITSTGVLSAPVGALLALSAPLALVGLMLIAPGALRRAGRHGPPRLRRVLARVALDSSGSAVGCASSATCARAWPRRSPSWPRGPCRCCPPTSCSTRSTCSARPAWPGRQRCSSRST